MTVKEIITLAAENLGREDLSEAISQLNGEPEGEVKSLLRCYNLVESEVALDYCPLKSEEEVTPVRGKLSFSELQYAPVHIYSVEAGGEQVPFTLFPDSLTLPAGTGKVVVKYAYAPPKKSIGDRSAFSGKVSARLLSYGVASEFCLSSARYNEAALYERRFHDALRACNLIRRKLSVRARRWV